MADLFLIKADLDISLPNEIIASGEIANLALIDFEEDVKLDSISLTLTDKSFIDHVFELAGMAGNREYAAAQLNETLMTFAMMGGLDMQRFVKEATDFIAKPGKIEIRTNLKSPVSFEYISRNPFAINLSLTINGRKPFTIGND